jgi:hypothetical protein
MKSRSRTPQPRPTTGNEIARGRWSAIAIVLLAVLTGCGQAVSGPQPSAPSAPAPSDIPGDPALGRVAFVQNCAQCHASRDGFDLAAFGFSSLDVIRRSRNHVDDKTSRDIAAYIAALEPHGSFGSNSPFQPGARVGSGDLEYWADALGTSGWPTGLTPVALRAIDPRVLPVPLAMPEWSLEGSDEDWLPDVPLSSQVLEHSGGSIRTGLDAYYADPSDSNLLRVLAPFKAATEGPGLLCWQSDPDPCFDARRWMASLGAQHYLRRGPPESVPVEVAQVWWDVGTSAISLLGDADSDGEYESLDRVIPATVVSGARWV